MHNLTQQEMLGQYKWMVYHMVLRHMGVGTRKRLGDHSSPEKPTHAEGSRTCALATTRLYVCVCVGAVAPLESNARTGRTRGPNMKKARPRTQHPTTHTATGSHIAAMSSPTRIATHSDNKNVVAVQHVVSRSKRAELLGVDSKFHGCTIWFTGESVSQHTTTCWHVPASFAASPCTQDLFPRFFSLWASS